MFPFHKHNWKEVKREALTRRRFYCIEMHPEPPKEGSPVTVITQYCNLCKKYRQQVLDGTVEN